MQTPRQIVEAVAEDLVTRSEIAEEVGVPKQTVTNWVQRYAWDVDSNTALPWMRFPRPVRTKYPELWYWPDVRQWLVETKRMQP